MVFYLSKSVILQAAKSKAFNRFAKKISELADYITVELPKHIEKEDNILYPMALEVIPENEWPEIKKKCDRIGYCCFTPEQ